MGEGQRLDRDEGLVVIHAQGDVIGRSRRGVEHHVGGKRAASVDAVGAQPLDRRRHHVEVLLAERAGFAGVRIEAGDRQTRPRHAEARLEIARDDSRGVDDEFDGQPTRHLAQRQMDRHGHDRELGRP